MTFAEGFAQAYIAADQRKQQRDQDLEDTMFKYKMENLMADKKLRVAKQTQELQNAQSAKTLAAQYGDPSTAPYWQSQLNNGVGYDTLYQGIGNGDYQINKNYTKPTQTVQVPTAVSGAVPPNTTGSPLPSYDSLTGGDANSTTTTAPAVKSKAKVPAGVSSSVNYDTEPGMNGTTQWDNVNKRIDTIDPTLRSSQGQLPVINDTGAGNMLVYNPQAHKQLPDLATLYNQYNTAVANKDPALIRTTTLALNSAKQAAAYTAEQNAKAQGNFASQQGVILDDQGRVVDGGLVYADTRIDPETNRPVTYNITDPTVNNGQGVPISGNFRYLDKNAVARLNDITDKFGQASKEVKDGSANFVSAINSATLMDQIAKNDPSAVTNWTANTLTFMNNLKGEAGAAWNKLYAAEQTLNKNRQNGATDQYEKDAAAYAQALADFSNATVTSPENERTAINAALYRSARQNFIVNLQAANGLSGSKASDKDFDNYMTMIGGEGARYNTIRPVMAQVMNGVMGNLDAKRKLVNNDPSLATFKKLYGFDPGISVPRMQEIIANSDGPEDQKAAQIAYLKSLQQGYNFGVDQAGAQGAAQKGMDVQPPQNTPATGQNPQTKVIDRQVDTSTAKPVVIQSKEEFDKLPKGTLFQAPDGSVRRKP